MNFSRYFIQKPSLQKKIILAVLLFLFFTLGLFTRFNHLSSPNQVVFDEFYFFHFVVDYEKNAYFFDIHPPLGKLLLWGNAKFYGIQDFSEKIQYQDNIREKFKKIDKLDKKIKKLRKENPEKKDTILKYEQQYENLHSEYLKIQDSPVEKYKLGTPYNESIDIGGIRSLPAFFGAMLPPLIFLFVFFLTQSFSASIFSGSIILFSPALTVESQYVLMDSLLLFFVIAGVFSAFLFQKFTSWRWWIFTSIFAALSISTKWTGLSVLAIAGIILFTESLKKNDWKQFFLKGFFIWAVVISVYILTFFIHFSVLSKSGPGNKYHSAEFKASLENTNESRDKNIIAMGFWEKFWEANIKMAVLNAGITEEHDFASSPKEWIQGEKQIFFLQEKTKDNFPSPLVKQEVHLFTNPLAWKIIFFSSIFLVFIPIFLFFTTSPKAKKIQKKYSEKMLILFFAIGINIIPFLFITRPKFLYHAFEAFVLSTVGIGVLFSALVFFLFSHQKTQEYKETYLPFLLTIALTTICFFLFAFFFNHAPLIYGTPFLPEESSTIYPWE